MTGFLGLGSNIAFAAGGPGGAITGTALAGTQGILDSVLGSRAQSKQADAQKKAEKQAMIGGILEKLVEGLTQAAQAAQGAQGQGGAGTQQQMQQLQQLGREDPEALKSALQQNPEAAQALIAAMGGSR